MIKLFCFVALAFCAVLQVGASGTVATTSNVVATHVQPPQSVVVVQQVPAAATSVVQPTIVEPVVTPTITQTPIAAAPAIATAQTTEVTVLQVPTQGQTIQCSSSALDAAFLSQPVYFAYLENFTDAECPANTFCAIDRTCRQILIGGGAQTVSAASAFTVPVAMVALASFAAAYARM